MSWKSWERAVEDGPEAVFMKGFGCLVMILIIVTLIMTPIGCALGWFTNAAKVIQQELSPQTLLKKYEWFKDVAATLDAKEASLKVYERRFAKLKAEYNNKPRSEWAREDREQSNLWEQEVAGIRSSFNSLCAEYNSAMAKINWAFCNVGSLPAGADKVLPREYRPYQE